MRSHDMFQHLKPAPAPRRVLMHATDHGYDGDLVLGHMECQKCGHDGDWKVFDTESDCRRGLPCPVCNGGMAPLAACDGEEA